MNILICLEEYIEGIKTLYNSEGFVLNLSKEQKSLCKKLLETYDEISLLEDWYNNDMLSLFRTKIGDYVSEEQLSKLSNKITYVDDATFKFLGGTDKSMGFNGKNGSVINLKYGYLSKHNLIHETIHELSRNKGCTDLKFLKNFVV